MATKDITDLMVCQAYQDRQPTELPYDLLMQRTGECLKVCYRAMERAHGRGYIEYGVSLRSGWLTDKGKQLLKENMTQKRYADLIPSLQREAIETKDLPLTMEAFLASGRTTRAGLIYVISSSLYQQLIGNAEFLAMFDPAARIEDVKAGYMGMFLGADTYTDAFDVPGTFRLQENQLAIIDHFGTSDEKLTLVNVMC